MAFVEWATVDNDSNKLKQSLGISTKKSAQVHAGSVFDNGVVLTCGTRKAFQDDR